jgi:hypothetical protein
VGIDFVYLRGGECTKQACCVSFLLNQRYASSNLLSNLNIYRKGILKIIIFKPPSIFMRLVLETQFPLNLILWETSLILAVCTS